MPYAILRFQKRKAGGVAACERHNERKKEAYKSNPDIDMERSKNNYHLIAPPKYTYKKEINRMVAEAGCRTRKDSVMMVETLITASPEFMNQLPPEEQKAYFQTALDFISERVGKQNILSAVVHMDERTPHMHLCFVPITPDNKLSAKAILGNQKSLSEWQTAYHERMSSRWNGILKIFGFQKCDDCLWYCFLTAFNMMVVGSDIIQCSTQIIMKFPLDISFDFFF